MRGASKHLDKQRGNELVTGFVGDLKNKSVQRLGSLEIKAVSDNLLYTKEYFFLLQVLGYTIVCIKLFTKPQGISSRFMNNCYRIAANRSN